MSASKTANPVTPEAKECLINPRSAYDWSRISNELDDMRLSGPAFRVYCNLLRRSDKHSHSCYPGVRLIAHDCRFTKTTVVEAIKELEKAGMLKAHKSHGKRTDYAVQPLSEWKMPTKTVPNGGTVNGSKGRRKSKTVPNGGTLVYQKEEHPVYQKEERNQIQGNPIQEPTTTPARARVLEPKPVAKGQTVVVVVSSGDGFEAEEKRRDETLEALRTEFRLNPGQANEVRRIAKDKGLAYLEERVSYARSNAKKNRTAYLLKLLKEDAQITVEPDRKSRRNPKPDPKLEVAPSEPKADFLAELAWWQSASPAQREDVLSDPRFDLFRKSMRKGVTAASLGLPVLQEVLAELARKAACAAAEMAKAQQPEQKAA